MGKLSLPVMIAGILLIQMSCGFPRRGIVSEKDVVNSFRRISYTYQVIDFKMRSPLISLEQTIVKEIMPDQQETYRVYDYLSLTRHSFELEDNFFLIADDQVIKLIPEKKDVEVNSSRVENTKDILTSDSTTVKVVTGYSESSRKIARLSYVLTAEMVAQIKASRRIRYQYYAGPQMISVAVKGKNLRRIKRLIAKKG
jgi:hypothetical protein